MKLTKIAFILLCTSSVCLASLRKDGDQMEETNYVLGKSDNAEYRLKLLNEIYQGKMDAEVSRHVSIKSKKVLVIGCGSGHLESKLDMIASKSFFLGLDICPKRIQEAKNRFANAGSNSNSFSFVVKDITKDKLGDSNFDIIFSRFVLSHLPNPVYELEKVTNYLNGEGIIVLQELASTEYDLFCKGRCEGYNMFSDTVNLQHRLQGNDHFVAFKLLDYLQENDYEILSTFIEQPILRTEREKSIFRIETEDSEETLSKHIGIERYSKMQNLLHSFEKDPLSYALYAKSVGIIAKKKNA